jgi:ABC-2 type transport system ATP-binding protein
MVRTGMPPIEPERVGKRFAVAKKARRPAEGLRGPLFPEREYIEAVDGIGFGIERGEMVGFIGPNGAGKSTTIKMLTGILVPTSGRVGVLGLSPYRDRRR